jgi:hypothetical protein
VREDAQAAADVELPDDVGRAGVETSELAFRGHVVQPLAVHVRRARRRGQQPLPQAPLDSRGRVLPEEAAVLRAERQEDAHLLLEGGVEAPGVVGAHVDRIAGNDGTAERLVPQLDAPDDVPTGGRVPVDRRAARRDGRRLEWESDRRRGHDV